MKVWILTLILAGHGHHYCDGCVYASQSRCEAVLDVMRESWPRDPEVSATQCRQVWIQGEPE